MSCVSIVPARRAGVRAAALRLALATSLIALALPGCGPHKPGPGGRNLRPHVRLTAGPARGDSVRYNSTFSWYGWDDDGVIDHYQYAIDIPGHFTQDDIDNPAATGIAWRDTLGAQAAFVFVAAQPETLRSAEGNDYLTSRPYGPHTLYLRSVDNEGGRRQLHRLHDPAPRHHHQAAASRGRDGGGAPVGGFQRALERR